MSEHTKRAMDEINTVMLTCCFS